MRTLAIVFTLLAGVSTAFGAVNCAAIGQNGWVPRHIPEECYPARTFGFATPASPARLQEIVRILKTLDFVNVAVDESASTVTVRGSAEKLAMTDWLLRELDQSVAKAPRLDKYMVSAALQKELSPLLPKPQNSNDQVMGVFFLAHVDGHGFQEVITNLRIVGDVWTLAYDTIGKKLVVRGPEAQLAMVKYLVDALDVVPGTATAVPDFTNGIEVVRVFFPGQLKVSASNAQIIAALRNVVEIKRVFAFAPVDAIAVRGSADEIAAPDWLMRSLEPKLSDGAQEFRFAGTGREDNVMRVFYRPRAKVDALKSSTFSSPDALLVRGSESQVAAANN